MIKVLNSSKKASSVNGRRTVLITGCSSGFGKLLVNAFLDSGWRVIATMRNAEQRADMFADTAEKYGERLVIASLDVTSASDREAIVDVINGLDGSSLDCLVNNAGYALWGALETCNETQLREQYEVNLIAPVMLIKKLLPFLRASKGAVINVSSLMGFMGFPMSSTYCSSKAGLSMLSESLSHELESFGVRVHSVEPGGFKTGFVTNSLWGDELHEDYESHTSGFQSFQDKLNSGEGNDPAPVVKRIVELATNRESTLSHQVGADAKLSKLMQKSLPESVRMRLMGTMFRRILQ